MRTLVVLSCLLVLTSALWGPFKKAECDICRDVVEDTEGWVGKEDQRDEQYIIKKCESFFDLVSKRLAKKFCDHFVESGLNDIIKHLEDPTAEVKDADAVCAAVSGC
uniref:Saposin B-type domain-containing protein n=1 Tax=Steinernema glaseri TaxID=37863 RepID=A0A1I8AHR6_9BILA